MTAVLKDNIPTYVGMNRLSRPPESPDTHTPAESTEQTAGISCFLENLRESWKTIERHKKSQGHCLYRKSRTDCQYGSAFLNLSKIV